MTDKGEWTTSGVSSVTTDTSVTSGTTPGSWTSRGSATSFPSSVHDGTPRVRTPDSPLWEKVRVRTQNYYFCFRVSLLHSRWVPVCRSTRLGLESTFGRQGSSPESGDGVRQRTTDRRAHRRLRESWSGPCRPSNVTPFGPRGALTQTGRPLHAYGSPFCRAGL